MRARVDGAWREVTGGQIRINGAWRTIVRAQAYIDGVWRPIASFVQPMSVSVAPDPATRTVPEGTTGQTGNVTATPTGGRAPFTYAWTRVSGDTGMTITDPTSSTTRFSRFVPDTASYTAIFRCTVTDADGRTASDTVAVEIVGAVTDI